MDSCVYVFIRMHIHMHICIHICRCTCVSLYLWTYIATHASIYTYMSTCRHTSDVRKVALLFAPDRKPRGGLAEASSFRKPCWPPSAG